MKTATALKLLATAGALSFVMVPSRAEAASCVNDDDCPDSACGGQVCDYSKGMTCQPAGGAPKGQDGWCTVDNNCKCKGMGATCDSVYCTFTTPPAGGSGGSSAGSGGASGTGGSSASGGSTSTGGSTESGGTTGSGGGTASGGATGSGGASGSGGANGSGGEHGSGGSNSGPSSSNSSSGCSVTGSSPASALGILLGLSVLALRRLRRRA